MKRDNTDVIESTEKLITFAILCAKLVYDQKDWNTWAERWLSGEDRSAESAKKAMSMASPEKAVSMTSDIAWLPPRHAAEAAVYLAWGEDMGPGDPSKMVPSAEAALAEQMAAAAAQEGESEARQAGFELQDLKALSQNVAARYAVADNADQE